MADTSGPQKFAGIGGVADADGAERRGGHLDGLIVELARHQHARGQGTALAGVDESTHTTDERDVHIGIVEDHVCGLSAELEQGAFHGFTGQALEQFADRRRPGE